MIGWEPVAKINFSYGVDRGGSGVIGADYNNFTHDRIPTFLFILLYTGESHRLVCAGFSGSSLRHRELSARSCAIKSPKRIIPAISTKRLAVWLRDEVWICLGLPCCFA